jgi:hypothetical protein
MNYLIVVVGPTAIGKTAHSIGLAQALGCEILSCDSRQFYNEMCIGTAVPEPDELAATPHHFIQHKSIRESFNVGAFEKEAIAKFVDKNSPRMQHWLEEFASGIPKTDKEGCIRYDKNGDIVWIVPPNPEKAFLMLQAVMEYHLPKLARVESVGDEAAPQRMVISWKRPE